MKANLILVFLVLAPMLLQLFTAEATADRASDRPADTKAVETKPMPAKAPVKKPAVQPAPTASLGGSLEPGRPVRFSAQDAVTFM